MATAIDAPTRVPLSRIHIREGFNARLAADEGLKESVAELGVIVPLIVTERSDDSDYDLVAGHRRYAAALAAEVDDVPIVVRSDDSVEADAAVENLARSELTLLEQARAIESLILSGKSAGFAARVIGTTEAVIANRLKIMDLPERLRFMFGHSEPERVLWGPRDADTLHVVKEGLSEEIRDQLGDRAVERNDYPSRQVSWLLGDIKGVWSVALKTSHRSGLGVVPAKDQHLPQKYSRPIDVELQGLGKKHLDLARELEVYTAKSGDSYSERHYTVSFDEQGADALRALGVGLWIEGHSPVLFIADKEVLVDAVRQQIERDHAAMVAAKEAKAVEKKKPAAQSDDPERLRKAKRREAIKEQMEPAWAANLKLGSQLVTEGAKVEVTMDVAKLFVYALMGPGARFYGEGKRSAGAYDGGSIINILAEAGWRFVMADLHADITKTRKDGTRGALKLEMCSDQEAEKAAFKFLDGAKTPEELFGRAICLMVAATYAIKHVAPNRDRTAAWTPSNKTASAALSRLGKGLVPEATKQVRKAIAAAYSETGGSIDQSRL